MPLGLPGHQRCGRLGHPHRQHRQPPAAGNLLDHAQHLLDVVVAVGQDIAFAAASALHCGQAAGGHIPHIHEIVTAVDAGGQLAVNIIGHHLHQMVAGTVIGTKDTGRMHHHRIQPVIRRIEHNPGGLRLGLGIAAHHLVRGKMAHLMQHTVFVLFRNCVHRADVHQPVHMVFLTKLHHVARAAHIDIVKPRGDMLRDVDDAGGVDHRHACIPGALKQRAQRLLVPHVAVIIGHTAAVGRLLLRQQQPTHFGTPALQHTHQSTAKMAVCPGHDIQIFHTKVSFPDSRTPHRPPVPALPGGKPMKARKAQHPPIMNRIVFWTGFSIKRHAVDFPLCLYYNNQRSRQSTGKL